MSSTYNGKSGNITPPSALTITNVSAGATPTITISGSLPAAFLTGIAVDITGVQGATGVNGTWTATVTGASTFTIPSGAPGTYTSGGSIQPLYLQGITLPSDGDAGTASSVNVPFEAIQDQCAFLALATGAYKVAQYFYLSTNGSINNLVGSSPVLGGTTWGDWTGPIAALTPFVSIGAGQSVNVVAGDIVLTTVSVNLLGSAANNCFIAIWTANYVPGGTPTFLQSVGAGSQIRTAAVTNIISPCTVRSNTIISTTGMFDFKLRLEGTASIAVNDFQLIGGLFAEAVVLRPTSMPQ